MTNSPTMPIEIVGLVPLGAPVTAACEGEFCDIPDHHSQAIINRKLDDDAV